MSTIDGPGLSVDSLLRELRRRADADPSDSPSDRERNAVDLPELGFRVALSRVRGPDGDEYEVVVRDVRHPHPPGEAQAWRVLDAATGEAANLARELPAEPPVRVFRVPVEAPKP